jgi:hypothetical protein
MTAAAAAAAAVVLATVLTTMPLQQQQQQQQQQFVPLLVCRRLAQVPGGISKAKASGPLPMRLVWVSPPAQVCMYW